VLLLNFSAKFGLTVFKFPHCGNTRTVTSKRRKTNQTSNKQPKNGRQFLCNLTQTDLIFPTLKPIPMGLKIFPTAHFKNNFSQPHIGTFAKPHEPTHKPSFTKEPIFHAQKNILDKYIHYSRKVLIFAPIKSKICFQRLVNMVLEHQFSLQSNLCLTEK
jgi:hypothetical protein